MKTKVLGNSQIATPTVSAAAKASGDCIGGKITISVPSGKTSDNSVLLQQLNIIDKDKLGKSIKAVIFKSDFTAAGDGEAFDPTLAECKEIVDVIEVDTYNEFTDANVGISKNISLLVPTVEGTGERNYFIQLIAGEALTTSTANSISVQVFHYVD